MNMGYLFSLRVIQVATVLAIPVAKPPQMISSTVTLVTHTLNTDWLVKSKVA